MTRFEFERRYAEASGLSVADLWHLGMHGEPCDCGVPECQGWQMVGPRRG